MSPLNGPSPDRNSKNWGLIHDNLLGRSLSGKAIMHSFEIRSCPDFPYCRLIEASSVDSRRGPIRCSAPRIAFALAGAVAWNNRYLVLNSTV